MAKKKKKKDLVASGASGFEAVWSAMEEDIFDAEEDGPAPATLGYLQLCMERRYHKKVQTVFGEMSGLKPTEYWIHSDAGGAPKMEAEENRAAYAYENGARKMGWSAHGAGCGGFKPPFHPHEASDDEIHSALTATLFKKLYLYPEAEHYSVFVTTVGDGRVRVYRRGPLRLA
ncbi:MAG: hypothetical protein AB7S26_29300 [Sandaracinaceae bacterium]